MAKDEKVIIAKDINNYRNREITLERKDNKVLIKLKNLSYNFIKRLFDICAGLFGSICAIITLSVAKILYLLNGDKSPIFLAQKRIGKNGKLFNMYKVRTMVPNAQQMLPDLLANNPKLAKEYKKNKKLKNDPRITKVGKKLRRCSLDEMPQFINVLKGDMSIIGNRPYLPEEKKDMGNYFKTITNSRPGIISYWAVSGRNDTSFNMRLQLEEYYSERKNLLFDVKIGLSAVKVVFKGKGAK